MKKKMGEHEKTWDDMGAGKMGAMAVEPSAVSPTSLLSEMALCFTAVKVRWPLASLLKVRRPLASLLSEMPSCLSDI